MARQANNNTPIMQMAEFAGTTMLCELCSVDNILVVNFVASNSKKRNRPVTNTVSKSAPVIRNMFVAKVISLPVFS